MTTRSHSLLRTLPLALLAACGADTPDTPSVAMSVPLPPGDLAYVTNEDSQNLTVIHTGLDSVIATINVGTRPRGVVVSADGKQVYVALSGSPKCPPAMPDEECDALKTDKSKDGIAVVNAVTQQVERVLPGGSDPETFDLSVDGTRLFVSNEDVGLLAIVDIASGQLVDTVAVGDEPEGVTVQPDGSRVWVTGESDHDVTVVDATTGKQVGRVLVGDRPRSIAFTPDSKLAFVTAEMSSEVNVIDVATLKPVKTLKFTPDPADTAAPVKKPMGIVLTPDGRTAYVSTGRGGTVDVIDVASLTVSGSVKVGTRPWGLALTADGSKLYTANGPSGDVTVVDTKTLTVLKTLPAGSLPWGVAVGAAPERP